MVRKYMLKFIELVLVYACITWLASGGSSSGISSAWRLMFFAVEQIRSCDLGPLPDLPHAAGFRERTRETLHRNQAVFGVGWFLEWPQGRRLLNSTWPWAGVKPSLMVLWGVCWMFYMRSGYSQDQLRQKQRPDMRYVVQRSPPGQRFVVAQRPRTSRAYNGTCPHSYRLLHPFSLATKSVARDSY